MLFKAFLHKWYEERAGLLDHCDVRSHLMDDLRIHPALDCRVRSDHAHLAVLRRLNGSSGSRDDHSHDRDIKLIPHRVQRQRARSIAGDHDRLDLLCLQKTDDLL